MCVCLCVFLPLYHYFAEFISCNLLNWNSFQTWVSKVDSPVKVYEPSTIKLLLLLRVLVVSVKGFIFSLQNMKAGWIKIVSHVEKNIKPNRKLHGGTRIERSIFFKKAYFLPESWFYQDCNGHPCSPWGVSWWWQCSDLSRSGSPELLFPHVLLWLLQMANNFGMLGDLRWMNKTCRTLLCRRN